MSRFIKYCLVLLTFGCAINPTKGFSLLGTPDAWQTPALGYNPLDTDIGAPKNLGQEFRWNVPVITYGFDNSFLNYFGTNGVKAIDDAIAILNSLPAFSTLNPDLTEFPLFDPVTQAYTTFRDARRVNLQAQALGLRDLKSTALGLLTEELGLANAERWVWAMRARDPLETVTNYLVINRNFDPGRRPEPSKYVNGTRYTYAVREFENPTFTDAVENIVDPTDPAFSSVSSSVAGLFNVGLPTGAFYTYLTRDDIGGLRYIYSKENKNIETFPAGTLGLITDRANPIIITNIDLFTFSSITLTSPPAALLAQFPGLEITSTNISFTSRVDVASVYLTNAPGSAWGDPFGNLVFATNFITVPVIQYHYTFTNIITNFFSASTPVRRVTFGLNRNPWGDPSSPGFSTNVQDVIEPIPSGGVIILPPGIGGFEFSGFSTTNVILTSNVFTTNVVIGGVARTVGQIDYTLFTNVSYVVYPIILTNFDAIALIRPGVDKLTFRKVNGADISGPATLFTNRFQATFYTNGVLVTNTFQQVTAGPNIVFSAADLGVDGTSPVRSARTEAFTDFFSLNNEPRPENAGLTGPGMIGPRIFITFNNLGPSYLNTYPGRTTEASTVGTANLFLWGSFDGSTNAPIVYPQDLTLEQLETRIFNAPQGAQ